MDQGHGRRKQAWWQGRLRPESDHCTACVEEKGSGSVCVCVCVSGEVTPVETPWGH